MSADEYRAVLQAIRDRYGATRASAQNQQASQVNTESPIEEKAAVPPSRTETSAFSDDWRS
jgi:hypothetical protein